MKFMNIVFYLLFITSLGFVQQMHSAEQDHSAEAKQLRELCARQSQHNNAIELVRNNGIESYVNIPDENGRTALHQVTPFLWPPNQLLPDHYGQGQDALSIKAKHTRQLATLLIQQGAKNCKDNSGTDCINTAGTAWLPPFPAPALPDPDNCPDISFPYVSELQATKDWLTQQLS